ncbi:MAG: zinc ribbon domain-containing protein [Nitrospirota bacterium]
MSDFDPVKRVQPKTKSGYILIIISAISAFVLITRVENIFGYRYFVLSGHNILDQHGIRISNGVFTFLWIIVIAVFFIGIGMVTGSISGLPLMNAGSSEGTVNDTKKCPMCAETVKFEAVKCKHCGHMF